MHSALELTGGVAQVKGVSVHWGSWEWQIPLRDTCLSVPLGQPVSPLPMNLEDVRPLLMGP